MRAILLVAIGGSLGSVARYAVGLLAAGLLGTAFPWGTFVVNVLGSLAIGAVARYTADGIWQVGGDERIFLAVGILGGFTTFSSFTVETLALLRQGAFALALLNAVGSVLAGVGAAAIGFSFARRIA